MVAVTVAPNGFLKLKEAFNESIPTKTLNFKILYPKTQNSKPTLALKDVLTSLKQPLKKAGASKEALDGGFRK